MTSWDPYGALGRVGGGSGPPSGRPGPSALTSAGDPTAVEGIRQAVVRYGPAPGAVAMMGWEEAGARLALATGVYTVWRLVPGGLRPVRPGDRPPQQDCARVGPDSRCFCGHPFDRHRPGLGACPAPCRCTRFEFVPRRPEEVGEWWLPRRKGFDVTLWRAACRCKHGHDAHDPSPARGRRCLTPGCGCCGFTSAFACVACDRRWEEHETRQETEADRRREGRPVGEDFLPLAAAPDIHGLVFGPRHAGASAAGQGQAAMGRHLGEGDTLAALARGGGLGQGRGEASGSSGGSGSALANYSGGVGPGNGGIRPPHRATPERSVLLMQQRGLGGQKPRGGTQGGSFLG